MRQQFLVAAAIVVGMFVRVGLGQATTLDDVKKHGFVPNYSRAWSLRPEVLAAWRALLAAIRSHMDARRYELVTLIAASRLRCTY